MPSLLQLKMEEGGAKNQHQARHWEGSFGGFIQQCP